MTRRKVQDDFSGKGLLESVAMDLLSWSRETTFGSVWRQTYLRATNYHA
jgi:hypothetical protein